MPQTSTYIYRPKSSIFFTTFSDRHLGAVPKDWRPPIHDYAEVSPDSLYLVCPDGTVLIYKTAPAVQYGVLGLPDCKTDFTDDSPCVKDLLRNGKHKVWVHGQVCYVYTPAKFKKLLEQAGRKSLAEQLAYVKRQMAEARQKMNTTEALVERFSRGL